MWLLDKLTPSIEPITSALARLGEPLKLKAGSDLTLFAVASVKVVSRFTVVISSPLNIEATFLKK